MTQTDTFYCENFPRQNDPVADFNMHAVASVTV